MKLDFLKKISFRLLCLALTLSMLVCTGGKEQGSDTTTSGGSVKPPEPTMSTEPLNTDNGVVDLGVGLLVTKIGSYAGIYMEDGSDRIVSNMMMLLVKNTTGKDLQLARISVVYEDFTAEFEVTNLPAAQSVVVLEKNRHTAVEQTYKEITVRDLVYFQEPMNLLEEKLKVKGGDGYLDIENVSGEDITGTVYVYYKNSAAGMLYGGITYRAKLENGLAKGSIARVTTGHYREGYSTIVQVVIST